MMPRGFILVEVLIALVISSMLTTALFVTMWQVSASVRSLDAVINVHNRFIIATRQLERDLTGAMLVHQEDFKKNFFSEQQDGNSHLLTFITNNPLPQWQGSAVTPYLVRVTYRLIPEKNISKGSDKRYILTRQESPSLIFDQKANDDKKFRPYEMIDGITQFKTIYTVDQDAETEARTKRDTKKITTWDSDSDLDNGKKRESHQILPKQIKIELELVDSMKIKHLYVYDIPIIPDFETMQTSTHTKTP